MGQIHCLETSVICNQRQPRNMSAERRLLQLHRSLSLSKIWHDLHIRRVRPNYVHTYIYTYIGPFKTSGDAFRLPYSIAFDCSIRPFLDLSQEGHFNSELSGLTVTPCSSGNFSDCCVLRVIASAPVRRTCNVV